MIEQLNIRDRSILYAMSGILLGIGAPIVWLVIQLLFFSDPNQPFYTQIFADLTKSAYHSMLYLYMGVGTSAVMAMFGYFIGKASNDLHLRAAELSGLHEEVASQKEIFENRYKVLDNNIKNFHHISSKIQKSVDVDEVLYLCGEGLHDILGYERVNILVADEERRNLLFVTATGSLDFNPKGVSLPLDSRSGVIYKCFNEKRIYLVEDITKHPADFHLKAPFDQIKPLRSRSFVLCPIVVKGESIGVFGIDNRFTHRSLNDTDVDTIKLFADQAASAIMKIDLLKAIDRLTADLEKTFTGFLQNRTSSSRNVYNMKVAVDSFANGTAHIAAAAENIMVSVDETSASVEEISVSIDQVTRNLDNLSVNVDKSAAAMEEINASIKNVESSAALSHDASRQVKEVAEQGREGVQETINALDAIQQSVEESYSVIQQLYERSGRIENIINVIDDITKKTSLLALNASIIAAQAGEYGKSFAVVADEIRNLSQQTSHSTGEITEIIDKILTESRLAAQQITQSKDEVVRGVKLGHGMGQTLQQIVERAVVSMTITQDIEIATGEQARGVQMVTHTIEDVSSLSSQIFNASKEQSRATKNIVQSINSIKQMTQEMVKVTSRLMDDRSEIKKSVDNVGTMVDRIFDDMEHRREESGAVVKELEFVKKTAV